MIMLWMYSGFQCVFVASLLTLCYIPLTANSAIPSDETRKASSTSSQQESQTVRPKSTLHIPDDLSEEIRDPCQTAEILEQPWRHWSYDDSEVPSENGRKKFECDAQLLPLRRWFGFSVNGIRSEIIYGHVKPHRCGTLHPLSLSFDNSLLFQRSMLYPQLKSWSSGGSGVDEYDDDDDNDVVNDDVDDDNDDDKDYLSRRRYFKIHGDKNKNLEMISSVTSSSLSSAPPLSSSATLLSMMMNDSGLPTRSYKDFRISSSFSNNSEEQPTHTAEADSVPLNSRDPNSVSNEDFPSTSTKMLSTSQTFYLPKYERVYDYIFESHSRRLYSYMLRDMDTIQELQQFLILQQLLMNSSIIDRKLHDDEMWLGSIRTLTSLLHSGKGDLIELDNNGTKFSLNVSTVNTSACYAAMKKLEESVEQRKKNMNVLAEERERITKLRKTKLHSKKKNQRLAFLRQNFTVAQLCVYHRFLDESSCVDALSVPIVIKKCPSGAVYWLEKMISQCPSGACVKKINETASYEVFLNIPKEELMLKPLSQLVDNDLKSLVSVEFNVSSVHTNFKNFCSTLRPILAKKLKLTISTKSRSPRKFLKVKGKPTERNYTRVYKEEKFDGALIPDLDPDAAGPKSQDRRKNKLKRNVKTFDDELFENVEGLKNDLKACDGVDSILNKSSPTNPLPTSMPAMTWESMSSKDLDEEYTNEDLELVKFVDYEPIVLDGKLRISIFVDGNTSLIQGDVLDAVKSLNASGELDAENVTLSLIYPGFPGDISQIRSGSRAAKFWQENKDMLLCAFVILGILSLFILIYVLCRIRKTRKKKEQLFGGKRYHKYSQTDHLITGYIFGTSTPIVFFKSSVQDGYEDLVNEVFIED